MSEYTIFEPDYYQRLFEIEQDWWWSIGMRAAMFALLGSRLEKAAGLSVLDAGCGTGYLVKEFTRQPGMDQVVGFDLSLDALRYAQRRTIPNLLQADVTSLPFSDSSFDLIVCTDTLQHLSPAGADAGVLDDFKRLLRPGGLLYIRTNSALGHRPLKNTDPNLYRRYTKSQLVEMVRRAGLVPLRATYLNGFPGLWGMFKEFVFRTGGADGEAGPGLAVRLPSSSLLSTVLAGVLRLEAWLIGTLRWDLPFGHSLGALARKR